jgi:transposase-like protein
MMTAEQREQNGRKLASQVTRIDDVTYKVKSQTSDNEYDVLHTELGWICSCCDHVYRGVKCKHIYAVEFSQAVRKEVKAGVIIQPIGLACQFCNSKNFVKDSVRHNKGYDLQRYRCRDCNKRFSVNIGFEGMRATPQIITSAMQLYFTGESLRNVQKFLRLQGVNVSHVAVYKWINKYVGLMQKYLEQIKPNVSDKWRADELYIKVSGNMKYLFAMMDDETRFWIAQEVADSKHSHDARGLLQKSKELTGKKPMTFITDGLPAYHDAYNKEFFTLKTPRTKHVNTIKLHGDMNNNKMERLNGEIRDREKVMRGLKKVDTKILVGYQIYHNYVRPHDGLEGKTPAEACGIEIHGTNRWSTIIENAVKNAS